MCADSDAVAADLAVVAAGDDAVAAGDAARGFGVGPAGASDDEDTGGDERTQIDHGRLRCP